MLSCTASCAYTRSRHANSSEVLFIWCFNSPGYTAEESLGVMSATSYCLVCGVYMLAIKLLKVCQEIGLITQVTLWQCSVTRASYCGESTSVHNFVNALESVQQHAHIITIWRHLALPAILALQGSILFWYQYDTLLPVTDKTANTVELLIFAPAEK